MSVIIVREKGAAKIDQKLLKDCLGRFDGFGITFFNGESVKYTRRERMNEFMDCFQQKEIDDYPMVIHLIEFWTGDHCLSNIQPLHIHEDIGVLSVNGYIADYPEDISLTFQNGKSKTEEVIIGEMFKQHCLNYPRTKPIGNWNRFLSENKRILENVAMVLMLPDGSVLNKNPEYGIYTDKGKVWFSEEITPMYDKSIGIDELIPRLDEWQVVRKENLAGISKSELAYLCNNYSYQIAELLKYGQVGYDFTDNNKAIDAIENEMRQCFDCLEWVDKEFTIPINYRNEKKYLCPECVRLNGRGT